MSTFARRSTEVIFAPTKKVSTCCGSFGKDLGQSLYTALTVWPGKSPCNPLLTVSTSGSSGMFLLCPLPPLLPSLSGDGVFGLQGLQYGAPQPGDRGNSTGRLLPNGQRLPRTQRTARNG